MARPRRCSIRFRPTTRWSDLSHGSAKSPRGLRGARDTKGRRVDLGGDVWTVLVNEFSAAPRGWSKAQYAWLFRRGRWNHQLELSNTILVGVIE